MAKLLVVDDEKNIRDALGRFLGSREPFWSATGGSISFSAIGEWPR